MTRSRIARATRRQTSIRSLPGGAHVVVVACPCARLEVRLPPALCPGDQLEGLRVLHAARAGDCPPSSSDPIADLTALTAFIEDATAMVDEAADDLEGLRAAIEEAVQLAEELGQTTFGRVSTARPVLQVPQALGRPPRGGRPGDCGNTQRVARESPPHA